ncbi:hypothetical protein ACHQM5_023272 [Ranunculus cassubicifolius]
MESSPSQKRVSFATLDRLSSLPPEMINLILKRVPIRDVVRTSVLSRFWRCRWMLIGDLVFDARSFPQHPNTTPVEFINHVLLLHNEKVSRFQISNYLNRHYPDVDQWLHLLARKLVKGLTLEFPSGRCKLSSTLFSCQNLRQLKLQRCMLNMPSYGKGFCKLVDLHLRKVTFTNETIASLILNCPLTRLVLLACDGFSRLNINAPDLQIFALHGPCESINFGNAPKLAVAEIKMLPSTGQVHVPRHNGRRLNFEDVLGGLVNVEDLDVNNYFIQILVVCTVAGRLCITFCRLRYISLELNLDDSKEILTAAELLRSSPHLQYLNIDNCSNGNVIHSKEGMVSLQTQLGRGGCILRGLGTVALTGFKGRLYEMIFLAYLLSYARILQTMTIQWEVSCIPNDQGRRRLLEHMLQFPRASPMAKVVFLN